VIVEVSEYLPLRVTSLPIDDRRDPTSAGSDCSVRDRDGPAGDPVELIPNFHIPSSFYGLAQESFSLHFTLHSSLHSHRLPYLPSFLPSAYAI
jgi:hypothetical protein